MRFVDVLRGTLTLVLLFGCESPGGKPAFQEQLPLKAPNTAQWLGASGCAAYDLELRSSVTPPGADSGITTTLNSRLLLRLGSSSAEDFRAAFWLEKPVVKISAKKSERHGELEQELSSPILVEFKKGIAHSIRGLGKSSGSALSTWRSVVAALQLATPPEGETKLWKASEYDATGRYFSEYVWTSPTLLRRSKKKYTKLLGKAVGTVELLPGIEAATWDGHFADGHLIGVSSNETLRTQLHAGVDLQATLTVDIKHRRSILCPPQLSQATVAALANRKAIKSSTPPPLDDKLARHDLDKARVGNWTIEKVVKTFKTTAHLQSQPAEKDTTEDKELRKQRHAAFTAVAPLLRLYPDRSAGVRKALKAHPEIASELTSSLAGADTPEAERILSQIVQNEELELQARGNAMMALGRSQQIGAVGYDALESVVDHPRLWMQSVMALGAAGRRSAASGDQQSAERVRDLLRAQAGRRKERNIIPVLRGFSNLGDPFTLSDVRPSLKSSDSAVRAAAYAALRHMKTAETKALILAGLSGENDASAQRAILNAAGMLGASVELKAALTRFLGRTDIQENIRATAVRLAKAFEESTKP